MRWNVNLIQLSILYSKLIFNSPWYYVLICLICGLTLASFLYYRNKKNTDIPKSIIYGMFALRSLSVMIILLLLLNIFLKQTSNETQNPIILLAIDNSKSMMVNKDSIFIKKEFLNKLSVLKDEINKNFTVKTLLFGGASKVSETNPDFSEKE